MADLTAIILTKNEELNISKCIESIQFIARRILLIDSFSVDNTVSIARRYGVEVYQNEFINYATQFKYALNNFSIDTRWVLRIDADEFLTKESAEELDRLCEENMDSDVNGIILRFKMMFMGKYLKHGGVYPIKKLLVFKFGCGDIEERYMDEHTFIFWGRSIEMKNDSLHLDYKDLSYWVQKHNWYSTREINDYFDSRSNIARVGSELDFGARIKRLLKFNFYYNLPMNLRAYLYYIYRYYFRLGFLDGKEGEIYAFLQAYWYRFLVDAKIYEAQLNGVTQVKTTDLNVTKPPQC